MSEILRKWLNTRLGVIIDYDLNSFEDIAQDGTLIAEILYNYGIINSDNLSRVTKTYDFDIAYRNLVYLRHWLKSIGLNCTEKYLHDIAHRDKTAAVKLFYQLYVILNTKTKLNYIMTKSIDEGIKCKSEENIVDKPYNACEINEISVSAYVNDTRNILKWHKNKYMDLMKKCKQVREEYGKKLEEKLQKSEIENRTKTIQIEDTKNQTLILGQPLKKISKIILTKPDISLTIDAEGHCIPNKNKAKQYVKYLQQKQHKHAENKIIQCHINKLLLSELLSQLIEKEDAEFKEHITNKLLKQSCYEKQMAMKLIEVRHQKETMIENLKNQHEALNKTREQEFIDHLFQQNTNLTYSEKRFIENKNRQYELHKRLWAEKKKREYKENTENCENIIYDIIDLSVKSVQYRKQYEHEVPENVWREWVSLFLTEQPIYDTTENIIDVIDDLDEMADPLTIELYRQNGLDEEDYADYNSLYGLWNLELPLQYYDENQDAINLGLNVLGFVVHRLLLSKYPKPDPPTKPILPPTDVRACLTGVDNNEILSVLQKSLTKKEVLVLEMQTVINFFLNAYHEEDVVEIDTKLNEETEKGGKKEKPKKEKKGKKDKKADKATKKKGKKGDKQASKEKELTIEKIPKETQTPKLFPGEEITLSKSAELGKFAYETLNLGLEINENLMTTMLVEYLKPMNHIKGWVLINFPETINEAYMLEEVLNGMEIPEKFINEPNKIVGYDLENRDDIFKSPSDPYIVIRQSKLLPNPKPPSEDKYISFFTSFIHLCLKTDDLEQLQNELNDSINLLISFYDKLSINNSFSYKKIDFELVRDLVKHITRDEYFANQIYEELVSNAAAANEKKKKVEEVSKTKQEKPKKEKKGKDKKGKKDKKEKPTKEDKKSKISIKSLVAVVEKPVVEVQEIIELPKPGEENWEYVILPLPKEYCRILATTWQDVEEIYENDFKELFFSKRVYQNQIIPYVHEIATNMQHFIERPDNKQEYVHNFQKIYNGIEKDLREDDEFKAELHYQLSEFRNKLWFICDTRMKESEEERRKIIKENWFTNHSSFVTNLYSKAAQLELDRCLSSLQLLQDYYTCMASNKPLENKLPKHVLPRCDLPDVFTNSKRSSTQFDKTLDIIANMLIDTSKTTDNNPFFNFLNSLYQTAKSFINSWLSSSLYAIKIIESSFVQKTGNIKSKKKQVEVTLTENDIMIRNKIEQMIQEWNCSVEGEILRTRFRIKLIIEKAIEDVNNNLQYAEKLFHDIYDQIQERYNEEVESVDSVCQIFARAIEACEPVQIRLVLDGSKFHVDQNILFYPDAAFPYEAVKERLTDIEFSVAQLNLLSNIFLDLGPNGYMPQCSFIYLLQDIIVLNTEGDCDVYLPQSWYHLRITDINKLIKDLYGDSEYIDWRDFIIWNLLLPYPTEYELLEIRRQFRQMDPDKLEYVNSQQFSTVNFWFEEEFSDEQDLFRMNLIKDLLCKMFTVDEDRINYTGLLLYFCKDVDSMRGVCKALELAVGNLVCWDADIGVKFIEVLKKQRQLEEQRKQEAISTAMSIVGSLVNRTMTAFESVSSFQDNLEEQSIQDIEPIPVINEESQTYIFEECEEETVETVSGLPALYYFLPYPVLIKVMTAAFPWHTTAPCVEDNSFRKQLEIIYNSCHNDEFDTVFMHDFLNNEQFIELINRTSKFLEHIPSETVRNLVEVCTCGEKE